MKKYKIHSYSLNITVKKNKKIKTCIQYFFQIIIYNPLNGVKFLKLFYHTYFSFYIKQ